MGVETSHCSRAGHSTVPAAGQRFQFSFHVLFERRSECRHKASPSSLSSYKLRTGKKIKIKIHPPSTQSHLLRNTLYSFPNARFSFPMGTAAGEGEGSAAEKALRHVRMESITFTSAWRDLPRPRFWCMRGTVWYGSNGTGACRALPCKESSPDSPGADAAPAGLASQASQQTS